MLLAAHQRGGPRPPRRVLPRHPDRADPALPGMGGRRRLIRVAGFPLPGR
jgi:hypothetical protein